MVMTAIQLAVDDRNGNHAALFRELNRNGSTIVLITHDAALARQESRMVHIEDGVLTAATTRVTS